MKDFGLYIHIPFCSKICPYCDFNAYAVQNLPENEYVEAILKEFEISTKNSEWESKNIQTVYFGGGTPSIFSGKSIKKILDYLIKTSKSEIKEITIEANPEHLNEEIINIYKEAGINRISLGVQSLNNKSLKLLGRNHDALQVKKVCEILKKKIPNYSLDLIFGTPKQTIKELERDLSELIELNPKHISAYLLTIEKGTPFFKSKEMGNLIIPEDSKIEEMFYYVFNFLEKNHFIRYEVSNFAKAGFESKHNSNYWNLTNYLGLGAGAHSFYSKKNIAYRYSNIANPDKYMDYLSSNKNTKAWEESLSKKELAFERIFLGLRRSSGIELKYIKPLLNAQENLELSDKIEEMLSLELLHKKNSKIFLSNKGFILSDSVIERLLI